MLEEVGRIIAVDGETAWVETERKSTCHSCSANKGCGSGVLSRFMGRTLGQYPVINRIGAKVGDEVVLGIDENAIIRGSLAAYGIPLASLLAGAFIADAAFAAAGSDAAAALGGVSGLLAGLAWLRRHTRKIRLDARYQPVVLRRSQEPHARATIRSAA